MYIVEFEGFNDGLWYEISVAPEEGYVSRHDEVGDALEERAKFATHHKRVRTRIIHEMAIYPVGV